MVAILRPYGVSDKISFMGLVLSADCCHMRPLSKSGGIWQQSAEYIRLNKKIIAKSNGGRKIATIELIPDLLNGGYLMFNIQWIVISNSVLSLGLQHRFF